MLDAEFYALTGKSAVEHFAPVEEPEPPKPVTLEEWGTSPEAIKGQKAFMGLLKR